MPHPVGWNKRQKILTILVSLRILSKKRFTLVRKKKKKNNKNLDKSSYNRSWIYSITVPKQRGRAYLFLWEGSRTYETETEKR